jgi:hypothetical protein
MGSDKPRSVNNIGANKVLTRIQLNDYPGQWGELPR